MSSSLKLAQRLPRRSVLNRIYLQSYRTITTLSKANLYPSPITSASGCSHSHHCSCNGSIHPHHGLHHRSLSTNAQDKDEQNDSQQDQESEDLESSEAEESGSDNEQNQQITDLQSKVNELENELKKYKEALARSHADIMNIQNMNKKDVENARKFATKSFSKDMLNVADSLSGCLNVVDSQPGGEEHASAEHIKSVIDGVRVTQHALMDTFDRHGIKKIESMNAEFDPNFHEALFKMPTNDFAPDTVCQVISEGYTIKDAVLRAAKVGVSTPLPTPPSEENTTEESETNADSDEKKE